MWRLAHALHFVLGLLGTGFAALGLALVCDPRQAPLGGAALLLSGAAAACARGISRNRPPFAWTLRA
jgi:hypothetical protein